MTSWIGADVVHAAKLIAAGRIVAFPTETVYGLGADALNPAAVAAVFAAKERPDFDPLIVHVATLEAVRELASELSDVALQLAERFWPGPLTLVLSKRAVVPDLVTAGLPTVGLRIPQHPIALQLIEAAGVPIAAPSANLFGHVSPTTAEHVARQLGDRIDGLLDGGPCTVGVESTVLHLAGAVPTLLRPGGVSLEAIEEVIGPVPIAGRGDQPSQQAQPAPGMLDRHYSPTTPLEIVDGPEIIENQHVSGLLSFGPPADRDAYRVVEVLSETEDLTEAAANFYAALRRLDDAGGQCIYARRFPEHGLGRALNDRLQRAAAK